MPWKKVQKPLERVLISYLVVAFLHTKTAQAFWDTAIRKAEEAAKAAATASTIADVIAQIQPDTKAEKRLRHLQEQNEKLSSSLAGLSYLEADTKAFLEGPDYSSDSLEKNLRNSAEFIRRGQSLISRALLLGTDGMNAVNGVYMNLSLQDIQKNQAVMISQNERSELLRASREIEDTTKWQNFISRQKTMRSSLYKMKPNDHQEGMN